MTGWTRRELVTTLAGFTAGAAFPRGELAAPPADGGVRFLPEMEAVARWIEETPRERVVEEAVAWIRAGLPKRLLVGGLFLAGIRSIKPRPVGFKFHAVMVIAAAHELAFDSPADEPPADKARDRFTAAMDAWDVMRPTGRSRRSPARRVPPRSPTCSGHTPSATGETSATRQSSPPTPSARLI